MKNDLMKLTLAAGTALAFMAAFVAITLADVGNDPVYQDDYDGIEYHGINH